MALTTQQILFAYKELVKELFKETTASFIKPELKQALEDAEAWAESAAIKTSFNAALTAGDFKTNATADQKRLALIFALLAIVKG